MLSLLQAAFTMLLGDMSVNEVYPYVGIIEGVTHEAVNV